MALRAGFRTTIVQHDPAAGYTLAGFGGRGPSTDALEFPQIRVLALEDTVTGQRVAIVSADYCFFDQAFHDIVRARLREEGIFAIIACTHNHAAPSVYHVNPEFQIPTDDGYVRTVEAKIHIAVTKAFRCLTPVTNIQIHRGRMYGKPTMNRSIITLRDGVPWMHKRLFPDTPASVFTSVDQELVVITVATRSGAEYILVNFACHPVVLEHDYNSSARDFVGPMLRHVERGHPSRRAMFLNGALGDVNPALWEFGLTAASRYGRLLAAEVEGVLAEAGTVITPSLRLNESVAEIPYIGRRNHLTTMSCLWVGGQPIITIPGELYTEPGLAIKRASTPSPVIVCLAGGSVGYIPSEQVLANPGIYASDTGLRTIHAVRLFDSGDYGNPVGVPEPGMSDRIVAVAAGLIAGLCRLRGRVAPNQG